jgi:hypothetical protein
MSPCARLVASVVLLLHLPISVAAESTASCHMTDTQFLKELSAVKDWDNLYAVYNRYLPNCPDDGFYAEGYSDKVVVLLARRWQDFPKLQRLIRRDQGFRDFVYRHIDATTDADDLKQVLTNAKTKCPVGAEAACASFARQAEQAIAAL